MQNGLFMQNSLHRAVSGDQLLGLRYCQTVTCLRTCIACLTHSWFSCKKPSMDFLCNSFCYLSDFRGILPHLSNSGQLQVWHQRWQALPCSHFNVLWARWKWTLQQMCAGARADLGIKFWPAFSYSLWASTWAPCHYCLLLHIFKCCWFLLV